MIKTMDDARLLRKYVRDGSEAAFTELAERHMKLVYWTCRRDLIDPQLAEDAAQVVFILFSQKARRFLPGVSIPGWLFNTARLVAKDVLKRERRRRQHEVQVPMDLDHTAAGRQWTRSSRA